MDLAYTPILAQPALRLCKVLLVLAALAAIAGCPEDPCGNGLLDEGELCDDGYRDPCGTCNSDCSGSGEAAVCGDGIICPETETCDDGYADSCGSCNQTCTAKGSKAVCGDGLLCPEHEVCDDGFTDACGDCNANCKALGSGSTCGDGEVCPQFETCDDGETDDCGDCNSDCSGAGTPNNGCGDGFSCASEGEVCDDGYQDACGSCNADCSGAGTGSVCGDGEVCPEFETCDDGFAGNCGDCNADCSGPGVRNLECGDGFTCAQDGEVCDDGYNDECGTCNSDCTAAGTGSTCGDTVVCPEFETCDDGYQDACGTCNADCSGDGTGSSCGDSEVCPEYESCDDGYQDACGPCNADCSGIGTGFECGDNEVCLSAGETCDRGTSTICGECSMDCTATISEAPCGDGEVCEGAEQCDDGYQDACGSCNADCSAVGSGSTCGDGETCPETEQCDDGFEDACGDCNADCSGVGSGWSCGDGVACAQYEACDDGNTLDDDYCSADCQQVTGSCGDGIVQANEVCDDNDTHDDNFCSADCQRIQPACTSDHIEDLPFIRRWTVGDVRSYLPLCGGWVILGKAVTNTVVVYDAVRGKVFREYQINSAPVDMALDETTDMLYVAPEHATHVNRINLQSDEITTIDTTVSVFEIDWDGINSRLLVSDGAGGIDIVAGTQTVQHTTVSGFSGSNVKFDYSPQNNAVYFGAYDLIRYEYNDISSGWDNVETIDTYYSYAPFALSPDGTRLAISGTSNTVVDYNAADFAVQYGTWAIENYSHNLNFSHDSQSLAAIERYWDGDLRVYDVTSHALIQRFDVVPNNCYYDTVYITRFSRGDELYFTLFDCDFDDQDRKIYWTRQY